LGPAGDDWRLARLAARVREARSPFPPSLPPTPTTKRDGYPDSSEAERGVKNPTPDDATFVFLAKTYAAAHAFMSKSKVGGRWGGGEGRNTQAYARAHVHTPHEHKTQAHAQTRTRHARTCTRTTPQEFPDGITNGAKWYPV
jgi:hypothetical protein